MSNHRVIRQFPIERVVRTPEEVAKEQSRPRCFGDLKGQRPDGHPALTYGCDGNVLLEEGQVWVETGNGFLWVVVAIDPCQHHGTYEHHVWLAPYNKSQPYCVVDLSEQALRTSRQIWDEVTAANKKSLEQVARSSGDTVPVSRRFCGLDEEGGRIDDPIIPV